MVRVKYSGDEPYTGWDGDSVVAAEPGETIEVSDGKAEQLLADFPDWFAKTRATAKE